MKDEGRIFYEAPSTIIEEAKVEGLVCTGIPGMLVRSKIDGYTDNTIFLPAAGNRSDANLLDGGSYGRYWSSSLRETHSNLARSVFFFWDYEGAFESSNGRYCGQPVRPVME